MQRNVRIKRLDDFKWIAALLVVANHTSPLESVNPTADFLLTRVFARVAVPFFFMVTGYFVLHAAIKEREGTRRILSVVKKTGVLYLGVTLLYLPVQLYKVMKEPLAPVKWAGWALRAVFFDGTYYHLWYLPAAMLGLVLAYLLLRYAGRAAFPFSLLLYAIGLLGDSYYGLAERLPLLKEMYEGMFQLFSYTRNGLFLAPVFLILGYRLAVKRQEEKVQDESREAKRALRNSIVCLAFMSAEGLLLHAYQIQRHDSMYLILPILCGYLFWYLLLDEKKAFKERTGGKRRQDSFYSKGPMLLYFLHPLVILAVRGFVKVTKWTFLLTVSPVYYLTVLSGSLCAVCVCLWTGQRLRERIKRRN